MSKLLFEQKPIKFQPIPDPSIKVVEWRSFNRDERGIALIGSEIIGDFYASLYADGKVVFKNNFGKIKKEEMVDFDILKENVDLYEKRKISIIKISDLLEETKKLLEEKDNE